jgi:hypothetical protein
MVDRKLLILGFIALVAFFATNAFADQGGPAIRGRTSNDKDATFSSTPVH